MPKELFLGSIDFTGTIFTPNFSAMLICLLKTDSTVVCMPCMLEHVCYESFSLKN